jgi:hypothetical protein
MRDAPAPRGTVGSPLSTIDAGRAALLTQVRELLRERGERAVWPDGLPVCEHARDSRAGAHHWLLTHDAARVDGGRVEVYDGDACGGSFTLVVLDGPDGPTHPSRCRPRESCAGWGRRRGTFAARACASLRPRAGARYPLWQQRRVHVDGAEAEGLDHGGGHEVAKRRHHTHIVPAQCPSPTHHHRNCHCTASAHRPSGVALHRGI